MGKNKELIGWIIQNDSTKQSYELDALIERGKKEGIIFKVYEPSDFDIIVTKDDRKSIVVKGSKEKLPDFVYPRMGAYTTYFALSVIRHFERLGVPTINTSSAIETVKDKFYSLQILAESGVPIPKTVLMKQPVNVGMIDKEIGFPLVMKTLSGMQGKGVFLVNSKDDFQNYLDILSETAPKTNMIIQEMVRDSYGQDLRVIVIGGRVIKCMKRINTEGGMKANISGGGVGEEFDIDDEAKWIAVQATKLSGLDISGVDLLFDNGHYKVCEINSSPGFKGLEDATGYPITKDIFKFIKIKLGIYV